LAESLMQTQLESQWKHGWNSMEPRLDFWIQIGGHLTPSCTSSFFPFFCTTFYFLFLELLGVVGAMMQVMKN
jgi:hypothetical protein